MPSESETHPGVESSSTTTDPTDSTTADPTGTDSTTGTDPNCECVANVDEFLELTCEIDEICEPIQLACLQPADCTLDQLAVVNPEVLECHHDALAAATEGALRWELPFVSDPGVAGQRSWIFMRAEGQAITWAESWGAGSYDWSDTAVIALREPAYFDECMALGSNEETLLCLFDPAASTIDVCIAAHGIPFG